jgi:YidC/Oxa1 family membrane protein insertase
MILFVNRIHEHSSLCSEEEKLMSFFIAIFNTIFAYPIFNALMALYFLIGDFGLAIVVLTCLITLLLLPLTLRQFRHARLMRELQPQITAIRQQYATDQAAQKQALQALYQEHGIRPGSAFLPLLIQAPIYSGLYAALDMVLHATSVSAINQIMYPFLVHFTILPNINLMWFTILNAAWHISLGLPDPTHLLPLLAGVVTFAQMRMAQPISLVEARDAITHISQNMQLLFLLISVGITIVIAWHFAAGLALYRFVSLVLNMIQQFFTTGWGSLWTLPALAPASGVSQPHQQLMPPQHSPRKRHHTSSSSRRRGKRTRKGR